jgi:hypothetical protein
MTNLNDVRGNYEFKVDVHEGKTYKTAWGWLGLPGQVQEYRSQSAQRGVAGCTGDDAGHLIGNRFGAPGGTANLGLQNWKQNRYGTYKNLEDDWEVKRRAGIDIWVQVTDIFRGGEARPFMRQVVWKERVNGSDTNHELVFANAHTPESRDKQNIPPTILEGEGGKLIPVDFRLRRRL